MLLTPDNSQAAQKGLAAINRAKRQLRKENARFLWFISFSSLVGIAIMRHLSYELYFQKTMEILN